VFTFLLSSDEFSPLSSIGGVIGTGLFVGTADSLMYGGPVGMLLGYIVMGSIVYCVMITLGEMVCLLYVPDADHVPDLRFCRLLSCLYLVVTSNWPSASLTLHSLLPWVGITAIAGWLPVNPILPRSLLAITDLLLFST
jgi:hypothetical protein